MKLDFESNISTFVPGASDFAEGIETNNNSADISKMLREGIEAAQSGKSSEARSLLLRVTEADANNEKAWLWLASISEYPEELLVFLNNVLKINPENERALEWAKATKSLLSKTFVQRGIDASGEQGDFAKQCFLQATIHDSENEMAWLWLASIAESDAEKIAYLQRVLSINAENETAKGLLESMSQKQRETVFAQAEMFAARGENEQALYALEEYLRQSAKAENAWVLKSFLVASFAEKLECFEQVLQINPENEMAKMNADFLRSMMEKSAPEQAESEAEMAESEESAPQSFAEEAEEEVFAEAESEEEVFAPEAEQFSEESHDEPQHFSMAEEEFLVTDEMDEEVEQPQAEFESPEAHFEESQPMEAEKFELPQVEEMQFAEAESNEVAEEKFEAQEEKFEAPAESSDEAENEGERGYAFFQPEEKAEDVAEPQDFFSAETQTFNSAEMNFFQAENQIRQDAQELPQVYDSAQDAPEVSAESAEPQEAENSMESYLQSVESEAEVYEIEQSETIAENNYSHVFEAAENAPETEESASLEAESPSYFDEENTFQPQAEMVSCAFCEAVNEAQSIVCHSCRAVLTFADLEMVLANHEADKEMVGNAICQMEAAREENGLSADEAKQVALGYLNLGNLPKGLSYLTEAAKMNPDDIVLSSQINALKIRAAEIEKQTAVHDLMPKNLTILVVDDSATVRKLISGKLEKSGHAVIAAVDGVDALEKIKEMVPDLVLLDINMPRMDGYQVCKMIRSNDATKDVPVVMISGKDGFFDKVRGRMAGTTGYITKPFGPETLMKTVETYIV